MAKKKVKRKELLKEPDEFLTFSARAFNWVSTHRNQLVTAAVIIGVLIGLYVAGWGYWRYTNKKAQEAYNQAYSILLKSLHPDASPEEWKKAEEGFKRVFEDYGLSKVAPLALPEAAMAAYLQGRYDEAIKLYKKFLGEMGQETLYQTLTRLAMATCFEAKGDPASAKEVLQEVLNGPDGPFKALAHLSLARVYSSTTEEDKAKKSLEQFLKQLPDSPFVPVAKAMLQKLSR